MLLYLTSNENVNVFDFLENEHGIIIKKLSGHFSLKQFVMHDMRNLEHYQYVAVDVKETSGMGFSLREIQSKFSKEEVHTSFLKADRRFVKKEIKIAVTGVQNRVGTTTMAINLANFLSSIGAKVCYVEANESKHLSKVAEYYQGMTEKDGIMIYNGVKYLNLNSECSDEFDFIMYDMGVVNNKIIGAIRKSCDAAIICSTGKPYEANDTQSIENLLDEKQIYKVFSLVADFDKGKIRKRDQNVYFSNYTPDYFDSEVNEELWEEVLKPFVKRSVEV